MEQNKKSELVNDNITGKYSNCCGAKLINGVCQGCYEPAEADEEVNED